LDEIGGIRQASRTKTAIPAIVVIEAILDEPAVVAADAAGDADLLLFWGQWELAGLARAVSEPEVADNQVAGLAGHGNRVRWTESGIRFPSCGLVPHFFHLRSDLFP